MPVVKQKGDSVVGATINKTDVLVVKATRVGEETVLSQIINMVEEAQMDKAPIQRFADMVSNIFVPVVVGLSCQRSGHRSQTIFDNRIATACFIMDT